MDTFAFVFYAGAKSLLFGCSRSTPSSCSQRTAPSFRPPETFDERYYDVRTRAGARRGLVRGWRAHMDPSGAHAVNESVFCERAPRHSSGPGRWAGCPRACTLHVTGRRRRQSGAAMRSGRNRAGFSPEVVRFGAARTHSRRPITVAALRWTIRHRIPPGRRPEQSSAPRWYSKRSRAVGAQIAAGDPVFGPRKNRAPVRFSGARRRVCPWGRPYGS